MPQPPAAGLPQAPFETYAPPRPRRGASQGPISPRKGPVRSHGKRKRRVSVLAVLILLIGFGAVGAGLRFIPGAPFAPTAGGPGGSQNEPTPTPEPTPEPLPFTVEEVSLPDLGTGGFLSWAIMDRRSGEIWGSKNMNATTWTASMIKGWLAADYLRRADEANRKPTTSQLHMLEIMIRDSDNNAATSTYNANGKSASTKRLISLCKLTDSKSSTEGWGLTSLSARDTVRMADCIANGTAAGEEWTPWLLDMMRKVRGIGDFGPRKVLPESEQGKVAIKNGWLPFSDDHMWHVNCMAIGDTWAMAVLLRYRSASYPGEGNWDVELPRGQNYCQMVAQQLVNTDIPEPSSTP
jgi:hypothetical protein